MGEIKAGVIFKSRFCSPTKKTFGDYINYIDRDEAVRNDNLSKFSLYNDYMGNSEKTTGLFTENKDFLSQNEKKELKDIFKTAQENESVMWQHVISFDNRWLLQNGLINRKYDCVNERKLKEITRIAMQQLQKSENLENAVWSAAIHLNTDNIHIHIAMVEPIPMRQKKNDEIRGKLKASSFKEVKSKIVNNVLSQQKENEIINNIIRNSIIANKKKKMFIKDEEYLKLFKEVISELPEDRRQWYYGYNSIKHLLPKIDKMTEIFLENECKDEWNELKILLDKQQEKYRTAYGIPKDTSKAGYTENKIKDAKYRLGNVILRQMREFDKEERTRIYQEAVENRKKINERIFEQNRKNLQYSSMQYTLKATMELTRIFMKNELEKIRNEMTYNKMQQELEIERQQGKEQE
jgi:hypothetical protein